jgi:PAS domain S-box-containing protein
MHLLRQLFQLGIEGQENFLEYRRVLMINRFVVFAMSLSLLLLGINAYFGLLFHVGINIGTVLLLMPVLWMNRRKMYLLSSFYFVNFLCVAVCIASFYAYTQYRFTETENILFALLAVAIFLFDGTWRWFQILLIISEIFILKYFKVLYSDAISTAELALTMTNVVVVSATLLYFLSVFKEVLIRALITSIEHENVLFSLIDHVPIFMALLGPDRQYKMVNHKYVKAFGKPRNEIIGRISKDILPHNIWKKHQPMVEQALRGESPEFLNKTRMPDGSYMYAAGKYVPIKNERDEVLYVTVFVDDVSDLMKVEEELKLTIKEKDKLFSIIAHDIKSPLNLFEGLLRASDSEIITQEEFLVFKDKLRERFFSLQETINGLLEWARIQMERSEPEPTNFSPDELVKELVAVFKPIAEGKRISIVQAGKPVDIWMDKNHCRVILRNLIHNALKFTPNEGSIIIEYSNHEDSAIITVSDSGTGMSQDAISRVMAKKEITSMPGTLGETGTGLGLGLCLELIEKNDGSLMIGSNKGVGTKFIIKVPIRMS